MQEPVVRQALAADAESVFALLVQFAMSYRPRRDAFDEHYPSLLTADHANLMVAEVGARVVGYALAFELLTLYANGVVLELQELMVDPEYRSRGLGEKLVRAVVEHGRATGAVEVVVPTRRARDYYVRLGFEETASYLKLKLVPFQSVP